MSSQPQIETSQAPNNYLVWSIISVVLTFLTCCFCYTVPSIATAIVALVFSTKVNSAVNMGDTAGAQQASKNAKLWNMVTAGLFAAGILFWIVMFFVAGGMDAQREQWEQVQKILEQRR